MSRCAALAGELGRRPSGRRPDALGAVRRWHETPSQCGEDWTRWTPFTYPFNITQQPAISVPCGLTRAGLPAGLQIVGAFGRDALVLRAAAAFEQAKPFARVEQPIKPI